MSLLTLISSMLLFMAATALMPRRGINVLPCSETGFQVPCDKAKKILKIESEYIAAPVSHQGESLNFAVDSTTSGFGRLTSVGLAVTRGAKILLNFNVTTKAIAADRLASMDSTYVDQLNATERESYFRERSTYGGGLNIGFLGRIGVNLGGKTDRETQEASAEMQSNYNAKSEAVEKVLETVEETMVNINGQMMAEGVSFVPTRAFAFIKLATITFEDGSTKRVVTTDAEETEAASSDGTVVLNTDDKVLNVVPL